MSRSSESGAGSAKTVWHTNRARFAHRRISAMPVFWPLSSSRTKPAASSSIHCSRVATVGRNTANSLAAARRLRSLSVGAISATAVRRRRSDCCCPQTWQQRLGRVRRRHSDRRRPQRDGTVVSFRLPRLRQSFRLPRLRCRLILVIRHELSPLPGGIKCFGPARCFRTLRAGPSRFRCCADRPCRATGSRPSPAPTVQHRAAGQRVADLGDVAGVAGFNHAPRDVSSSAAQSRTGTFAVSNLTAQCASTRKV